MSLSRLRQSLASASPTYLAVGCFGLVATPAAAQEAASKPQTVQLQGMTVSDDAIEDGIKVDEIASPKFTQPLQDTPQTIQIIDKKVFNQQGATTLSEALRNSPGVGTFYAGENGNTTTGDAVRMRGFDVSDSIFVDGIRDLGAISRDIFNTEQVEVAKGPAGTDNGRTSAAGAINMVSKRAHRGASLSAIAQAGVDGQARASVDINQPIEALPSAALRLNAVWQDSDVPGRDHVKNQRIGLAPSLGLGLDTQTRAYLNFLYVDQDNVPDGLVPTLGLSSWEPYEGQEVLIGNPVDSENFYGTRDDHDDVTAKMATFIIEHDLSDSITISNKARWGETDQNYLLTAFMGTAGNVTGDGSDLSSYTIARSISTVRDTTNRILTDQINLRADFTTGAIDHNLSVGVEFIHEKQIAYGTATSGERPAANLYAPDWNDGGNLSVSRNGADTVGKTDTQAFYLFDTAHFFDDLLLVTGGLRLDHYTTRYNSMAVCNGRDSGRGAVPCGDAEVGTIVETNDLKAKDTLFNWKFGAVLKPVEPVSLYVNYAISQQPPGGSNFTLSSSDTNANNPNLKPQKAKTIEGGIKWSPLGGALAVNAAVFQTRVENEINSSDVSNIQSASNRVRGVELSVVGNITPNWLITAGYTHQKTKVINRSALAADGSYNLTYSPDDAFTSWTSYTLPFGLELGGGVRYVSGLRRGTDGAQGTPAHTDGYTVVDALASYRLAEGVRLRVNAYNLFDKDYISAINKSGYRYTPGTPQTFLFSADFNF
ncbi:catecholate siderophore receptor Fiu [Novosphingobium sp. BW1]|uniref:catecholate siderophore receptor Fiu n=1 Tax=Novosphingobium sp. BW1 TaxID=2592621 RepID=UPI0011DE8EC6|nr:catecholate siderophore receptor Fiu [Novosphingobium sp. BW1]TYC81556.1 catecholate siderophore receptor Fiu [Novosphingobium sp. BW1]